MSNERERVREEIAKKIWEFTRMRTRAPRWDSLEEFQKEIIREQADQILDFKDEQGRDMLAVLAEDQSLPEIHIYSGVGYDEEGVKAYRRGQIQAQQDMLKAGWVKRVV